MKDDAAISNHNVVSLVLTNILWWNVLSCPSTGLQTLSKKSDSTAGSKQSRDTAFPDDSQRETINTAPFPTQGRCNFHKLVFFVFGWRLEGGVILKTLKPPPQPF